MTAANRHYAANRDGKEKWSFSTIRSIGGIVSSNLDPIAPDGTTYVGSQDENLYAIGVLGIRGGGASAEPEEGWLNRLCAALPP
jgi:outer membrane protein assembly factor BamB